MKFRKLFERSGRMLFLVLLFAITFSFAMFQGGFVSWFIFFVTCPFLIYSLILFFVAERLVSVERSFEPSHIEAGENLRVTLKVKRKTMVPFVYITIDEQLPHTLVKENMSHLRTLLLVGLKRDFEWSYSLENIPRGEHRFEKLEVTFHDFFGWVQKRFVFEQEQTFVVYPRVYEMKYVPIQTQFDMGRMTSPFSLVKDTTMAVGIRNYQSGDRFSWIHWKSFAKSQSLRTKEFEDRQSQELFVMIDRSPADSFDDVVELTASIVNTIVEKQGDVSLLSVGNQRSYFSNIQGHKQLEIIMHHLATIEADYRKDFQSLLFHEKAIAQGGMLLFVTSELTDEKLMALAKTVKQGICFVISDNPLGVWSLREKVQHIRVVQVPKKDYYFAFTEVMKP